MHAGIDHRDGVRLRDAAIVIAERLSEHSEVHEAAAHAAVFGRIQEPHVTRIGKRSAGLEWILSRLVQLADLARRKHTTQKPQNAGAHPSLLLAEAKRHVRVAHAINSLMCSKP